MLKPCVFFLTLVVHALAQMEGNIVGGDYPDIAQHSHSAGLSIMTEINGQIEGWICGASVLNQRLLLTAGHCLSECNMRSQLVINLGDTHMEKGYRYTTFGFVIHEDFNEESGANDIGLLKSTANLALGSFVRRIALLRQPPYSEIALVAGWGITDEVKLTTTMFLKSVSQKLFPQNHCLGIFHDMPRGTFCAASPYRLDEYPAQGDSGAGLVVRGYIQIGLVSYKTPGVSRNVVVYTDAGFFYDWIKSNARRLNCYKL